MAYSVAKVEMWIGRIEDQVGGLAHRLEPLAAAGANLEFLIARRVRHEPGHGVVFLGPLRGARQQQAARSAGLHKASDLVALRVEGPNKPGATARLTRLLADNDINLRGVSATVLGSKYIAFLAFDDALTAGKAARLLRSAGGKAKR
ncbi:MAG TPA: ACT domain-containing protein [Gemmataceae bacterium]|nr:ACT domain-containing protein [Gemmataceae bacterium]